MDRISKEQRRKNMQKIAAKNTTPEIKVRKKLFKLGYRFRLHIKKLPGKPDIYLKKYKLAIFVNGCFWHRHEGCKKCSMPKSNLDYWKPKLENNKKRDQENYLKLKEIGVNTAVIWECETKKDEILEKKIKNIFSNIKKEA